MTVNVVTSSVFRCNLCGRQATVIGEPPMPYGWSSFKLQSFVKKSNGDYFEEKWEGHSCANCMDSPLVNPSLDLYNDPISQEPSL